MIDATTMFDWLHTRRSLRQFRDEPVPREVLERLIIAATTAPSATNRQPWRFAVVTSATTRKQIVAAVARRTDEMKAIIRSSHHGGEFENYGDFFVEPLEAAAAIIVPQYREYPDLIANLITAGGGDPGEFHTASSMQAELCSTSAAIMTLLLMAHAEGLGACWMAGPMVARDEIHGLLGIKAPWQMVGAISVGYPVQPPDPKPVRKPVERVITWYEEERDEQHNP
jgi:nitroreductase